MTPYDEIAERLRSEMCRDRYAYGTPAEPADIAATERALGLQLPSAYRRFLLEFGAADLGPRLLPVALGEDQNVRTLTGELRRARPRMPCQLVPFAMAWRWAGPMLWVRRYLCFDRKRGDRTDPCITDWAPDAPEGIRREEQPETFSTWLDRLARAPEERPEPPRDWLNNPGWERYWKRYLEKSYSRLSARRPGSRLLELMEWLRERGCQRILFAGNGISIEPYAFAHTGFDVTALDVSAVASAFVESYPVSPECLSHCLPQFDARVHPTLGGTAFAFNEALSLKRIEREHVPGGRVRVVTADMLDYSPEEPFDVVYSRRAYVGFQQPERERLARNMASWLRPGGVCVVEMWNISREGYRTIEETFQAAGFVLGAMEARRDDCGGIFGPMRVVRCSEAERLGVGPRVAVLCNGSG